MDDFRRCLVIMKVTSNFTLEELIRSATATKMGINNTPGSAEKMSLIKLAKEILQPLRDKMGVPITVTSGYRCPKLNKAVGGVSTSQHLRGEAADIKCKDVKKLFDTAREMMTKGEIKVGQLIDEKKYSWVHISLPTSRHLNQVLHL